MSWAEYKLLSDRQEPLYLGDKKVTKITMVEEPKLTNSYSFNPINNSTNDRRVTVIPLPKKDKMCVSMNYYESQTGTYPWWTVWKNNSYEYNLANDTYTLTHQSSDEIYRKETSGSTAIEKYSVFSQDGQGNSIQYQNAVNKGSAYPYHVTKVNDMYIWIGTRRTQGTDSNRYLDSIGVSDHLSGCFVVDSGTPEYFVTMSDIPKNNSTFYNAKNGTPLKLINFDDDTNDFYFLYNLMYYYQSNYTKYVYLFKGHINDDKTITYTYLHYNSMEGSSTDPYTYNWQNYNIISLSKDKFVFYDTMLENGVLRNLTAEEKNIFNIKDVASSSYYKAVQLKDNMLYLYRMKGVTQLYRCSYYTDGKQTWTMVRDNFNAVQPSSILNYYGNMINGGGIYNPGTQIFYNNKNEVRYTCITNATNTTGINIVKDEPTNIYTLDDLQFVFETN